MKALLAVLFLLRCCQVSAQSVLPLYTQTDTSFATVVEPGPLQYLNASGIEQPFLYFYPAAPGPRSEAGAPVVLICPGGGYYVLAYQKEGLEVARRLAANGIAAAVLMSRLPATEPGPYPKLAALEDGRAALELLRTRAGDLGLDTARLTVAGFSAGGHLAMLLSTLDDPAERPTASALVYPVITMAGAWAHAGSTEALLGPEATPAQKARYSGELRVDADTPPTFLVHAADDRGVLVHNVLEYGRALADHDVPFELHVLPTGGHGFGMYTPDANVDWVAALVRWLRP